MDMRMPLFGFFVVGVFSGIETAINLAKLIKAPAFSYNPYNAVKAS